MCIEHPLYCQQLQYFTRACKLIGTVPVNGCCIRKSVGILTGLGFLVGVDGFLASSQGARLLLPFLVKSCPLAVRVWPLFRLILLLRLTTLLSLSGPHWVPVCPLIALFSSLSPSLAGVQSWLTLAHSQFEFRVHSGDEISLTAAAVALSWML